MPKTHFNGRVVRGLTQPTLVAADFALGAGWGTTATATPAAGSTDDRSRVDILCQGAGIAANPTFVLTFKEAFDVTPFITPTRHDSNVETGYFAVTARTPTTVTVMFVGTPVTAKTYTGQLQAEA
jgi:hypothetical protein